MVIGGSICSRPYVSTCVLSIAKWTTSWEFGGDVVRAGNLQTSFGCCAGGVVGVGAILVIDVDLTRKQEFCVRIDSYLQFLVKYYYSDWYTFYH